MACLLAVLAVIGTGCISFGGSYEKHYTNPLAFMPPGNGPVGTGCATNSPSQPVVNGSESYEHHSSYDINPFVWIGSGLRGFLGGCGHVDNEVVVPGTECYGGGGVDYSYGGCGGYTQGVVVSGPAVNYRYSYSGGRRR